MRVVELTGMAGGSVVGANAGCVLGAVAVTEIDVVGISPGTSCVEGADAG